MSDATSFLSAGELPYLRKLNRDGLRTELDYQVPPVSIALYKWSEAVQEWVPGTGQEAVIRYANREAAQQGASQSTEGQVVAGSAELFAPFTVTIGDRFELPNGTIATVSSEPREEFGIVLFDWKAEEGS